ncbi:HD domain-containing protein [Rhizobium rhizogenes]|jgi:uncharacterized protein|uniref:HD domain-containing protein n=1 Tax=Rhizobium rhizogenes TaxID=359 RepID=UPI0022C3898D|nr:HD domain-containing protein [Rhizobium rhizogenes]MCZ7463982.1 HD domain-containing protein [Rhizobium rhizogenes]
MPDKDLIQRLEAEFLAHDDGSDASHDINHARRVMRVALRIAVAEGGGDESVIIAAAYLHDWVNLPKNHPDRARASQLSAAAAGPILASLGFSPARIEATCHAILTHSFSANIPPETLEARALQDADRLEALGAIGIARVFSIAGQLGSGLFDGEDPFAQRRPLDDRRLAVDHFAVKLLKLPMTMQTAGGRAMAQERAEVMRGFLRSLAEELGSDMPWIGEC